MTTAQAGGGQHKLVFVAGLHRSGTTPLARLLAAHPQVSGFHDTGVKEDEGQHLQSVYPSARAYGGAGRFAFDQRSHLTEASELASAANAQRLFDQWAAYWDLSKEVLVEKSPPNLVMTRFLQALYPQARFVVVTRHPVIVALSTGKWRGGGRTLLPLIDHWLVAHETFRADRSHLSHVTVLSYEDLVRDPDATLRGLRQFLDLRGPLDPTGIDPSRNDSYAETWGELVSSGRRRDQRLLAQVRDSYGTRMAAFGYDVRDVGRAGLLR